MELGLRGRVALVAGASQGLGKAVAMEMSREGARVVICALDDPELPRAVEDIRQVAGGEIIGIPADLSRAEDARGFVRKGIEHFGTVDILVSSSCTGFMIPAVDAHIANALRLGPRLARLPITEAGCAGGAVALARAADYVAAHPSAAALVLAVEFSSLTFQAGDASATNMVAAALFADGAGAAVLLGARHPAAGRSPLEFVSAASYFMTDSLGAMGYDVVDSGFKLVLDKRLPDFLRGKLRAMVIEFLGQNDLTFDRVSTFAIHPGGRRVLDVAEEELGLTPAQIEPSRSVLRDHGNMSSATILFVLDRALRTLAPGEFALGIGFGPGFAIELSLWRGVAARGR